MAVVVNVVLLVGDVFVVVVVAALWLLLSLLVTGDDIVADDRGGDDVDADGFGDVLGLLVDVVVGADLFNMTPRHFVCPCVVEPRREKLERQKHETDMRRVHGTPHGLYVLF